MEGVDCLLKRLREASSGNESSRCSHQAPKNPSGPSKEVSVARARIAEKRARGDVGQADIPRLIICSASPAGRPLQSPATEYN